MILVSNVSIIRVSGHIKQYLQFSQNTVYQGIDKIKKANIR